MGMKSSSIILYINAHLTTSIGSQSFGRIATKFGTEVFISISDRVGELKIGRAHSLRVKNNAKWLRRKWKRTHDLSDPQRTLYSSRQPARSTFYEQLLFCRGHRVSSLLVICSAFGLPSLFSSRTTLGDRITCPSTKSDGGCQRKSKMRHFAFRKFSIAWVSRLTPC